jgi:hypothetical protein
MSQFNRCVVIQKHRCGRTTINCKLGLWGVDAPAMKQAMDEATYYFSQYKLDGEYSSIIGGKSAAEILISNAGSK